MKILHVIDSMNMGGAQSLIVELAPVQKDYGNEVHVLQLVDSVDRKFVEKLTDNGIKVLSLSKQRSVRGLKNVFDLIPYLRQYDIVHVHLFPANYWVAIAKLISFCKVPIVTTEHSTDNKRRKIKIFKYIDSFIYKRYQVVIACADKAKETFEERYKSVSCLSIPNGVNISKYIDAVPYTKKELIGIADDSFVVTMVARFVPSKRQDTIVKSIAQLPDKFHAVFVGGEKDDPGLIKVKTLAQDLGVLERIHFLYLRSDVPRILKSSDAVVMSSEYEGLSLSSIEGMACGHPFIASDVNGLREVVAGAGILVKCADADELSKVILKLNDDISYRNEVTQKCQVRAAQFDIRQVAEKYINVYSQFVSNK